MNSDSVRQLPAETDRKILAVKFRSCKSRTGDVTTHAVVAVVRNNH